MSRSLRVSAPYVIAFLVPALVLGLLFAISGDTPLYGLFGGGVGLIGALSALATRVLLAPRMTESEIEALARELDEQEAWPPSAEVIEHEGLRRLHEDLRREQEFTELVQLGQEQERDDEEQPK